MPHPLFTFVWVSFLGGRNPYRQLKTHPLVRTVPVLRRAARRSPSRAPRYCDSTCQHDHWRRGHKQICKRIHRGGNAEQYHADKKYKEAVAEAVEACADDTKGQTCYICTQALHWKTKEGLVRGCACRGTAGFAHVSCLAEQAKILVAEAEENNLAQKASTEWGRWDKCSLCEQDYHGVVCCALGWAAWKTYLGRPETDQVRFMAMSALGNGLFDAKHYQDAASVYDAELSIMRRLGASEENMLAVQANLANTYKMEGRFEHALKEHRDIQSRVVRLHGEEHELSLVAAFNYATPLFELQRFEEAKGVLRKAIPVAQRVLGGNHEYTLRMKDVYARALYKADGATLDDLRESVTTLQDAERTARRVLGGGHPSTVEIGETLRYTRAALRARETRA